MSGVVPLIQVLFVVTGALALGASVLAATITAAPVSGNHPHRHRKSPLIDEVTFGRIRNLISWCVGAWAVLGAVYVVAKFAFFSRLPAVDIVRGEAFIAAVQSIALLQYLTTAVACAGLATLWAVGARTAKTFVAVAAMCAVGWFFVAQTGHAASAKGHELAVSSAAVHYVTVSVWFGGLVLSALVIGWRPKAAKAVLQRFSLLATWAVVLVGISGVLAALLRVRSLSDVMTTYGALLVAKTVLMAVLLGCGWWQRRRGIAAVAAGSRQGAWRVLIIEAALMLVTVLVAVALSNTAPPIPESRDIPAITPAEIVTGQPLPPWPTPTTIWSQWAPDLIWILATFGLAGLYVAGAVALRRRGDGWPIWRTAMWLIGMLFLAYLLNGAPMVYGKVLFSAHMLQHMMLSMAVPLLLVFGAPTTLLLRVLHPRTDGTAGVREWWLWFVNTPWVKFFANPIVAALNFSGSIILFYFSPLFALAVTSHLGHVAMTIHFLLAGFIFAEVLVGVDPGFRRPAFPIRLVLLFATMAFHAFFGVTMMSSTELLAATYFSSLGWGIDLLADQRQGGSIAWGIGEVPTLLLAVIVAVLWSRSDERTSRQRDKRVDRYGDDELAQYNAMLAKLKDD